jgi:hypothetical protein
MTRIGSLRELTANVAIAAVLFLLPTFVWLVGIYGETDARQASVTSQWILPWFGGLAIGLVALVLAGIRGALVIPLDPVEAQRLRLSTGRFGRTAVAIGVPAALILPAMFGADIRIFGVMFFGGLAAGIMLFEVYAAIVRYRAWH